MGAKLCLQINSTDSYAIGNAELSLSAQLEPDADYDGYGDVTQDLCPNNAITQGVCPTPVVTPPDTTAPDATITKKPAKRTTNRRASFRFTSSDVGSTFICQLDKKPATPCTSPQTYRVKVGKHRLRVFAIDGAGNKDASPATYKWRRTTT